MAIYEHVWNLALRTANKKRWIWQLRRYAEVHIYTLSGKKINNSDFVTVKQVRKG